MIGFVLFLLIFISLSHSLATGGTAAVTDAVISSGSDAVSLLLTLVGTMATWGGIMKIAERSGLVEKITAVLKFPLSLIFRGIQKNGRAMKAISMNVCANLLGLGNAATPLGIEAMKALEEEEKPSEFSTKNMDNLAVMNACSIEIIPTTVAALRAAAGSFNPMEILPCVIAVSIGSLTAALLAVSVLHIGRKK